MHVEDVFPSKLLETALEPNFVLSSDQEREEIRCQVNFLSCMAFNIISTWKIWQLQQVVAANVMLSGALFRAMDMLLDQKDLLFGWQVPKEWTAHGYRPFEFEEYLRSKWRDDLESQVLLMPLDQISWWKYEEAAALEQIGCYTKQLVRVPNFELEPIKKQLPVPKFLLPCSNVSLFESFQKVFFYYKN